MANINTYENSHLIKDKPFKKLAASSEKIGYKALHLIFILAPIIAGLDKFFYMLTTWSMYLAPVFPQLLGVTPETFMMGVGLIEIIAGIGVALKPKIFSFVVSAWLVGIIINLFILGAFYDIALRDLGLAVSVFALGMLSRTK